MSIKSSSSCLGCLILIAFNLTVGAWAFAYDLMFWFGKDIPWYADALCGMVGGEFVIPLAVISWILSFFMKYPVFQ